MSTTPPPPGQAPDGPGYPASGDFGTPAGQSPATPYGAPAPGPYGAPTPTPAGGPTASGSKTMGIASIVTGVLGLICCPGLFSVAAAVQLDGKFILGVGSGDEVLVGAHALHVDGFRHWVDGDDATQALHVEPGAAGVAGAEEVRGLFGQAHPLAVRHPPKAVQERGNPFLVRVPADGHDAFKIHAATGKHAGNAHVGPP